MDEYFCSKCNAILNDQPGFDPEKKFWKCTSCNQYLSEDDEIIWICDECGEILNTQSGFSDYYSSWTCRNCYHTNKI